MTWARASDAADPRVLPIAPSDSNVVAPDASLSTLTWDDRLAQVISTAGSPPIVAVVAVISTAYATSLTVQNVAAAWVWAVAYLLIAIMAPFLYLVRLVRRGVVTDLDVRRREQRSRPLLAAVAATGAAWLALQLGGAPLPLRALACGACSELILVAVITLRWKISIHSATAAGLSVLLWGLFSISLALTFVGVAAIAWSRWRLRRHTWAQTAVGAALGGVVYWLALAAYLR